MSECQREKEHACALERAIACMPTEEGIEAMSGAFKAMSEPSRLKILLALTQGELCVYHLVQAVGGTQSAVSHQLRILREGKIIRARRDGQNVVYSLADGHVAQLLQTAYEHLSCKGGEEDA
ncbi:MAG: winged helix-turn-helix transcriptional regulator [Clostridia bacterium]|nr:winged helix-turn-helix transcriptional regulator [Clostridia bacterium]